MRHTVHKLLAMLLALAMLLSVFAVAENDTQAIVGADGPIELGSEAVDDIQDPADGLEIVTDAGDGLLEGIEVPADDPDLGLDGNLAIDLEDGLDGAALESLEGELAPETEVAMNDG